MGNPRPKPEYLAEKLRQIRAGLELSQPEMLKRLGLDESMHYARISEYETGVREPSLLTLLEYARVARVHMEYIVDDDRELPERLPGNVKYEERKGKSAPRSKSKR
jgi:transcriptional regulator with XRE-family HTH domain